MLTPARGFGIHAELIDTVSDNKVSKVLAKIEEQYPWLARRYYLFSILRASVRR